MLKCGARIREERMNRKVAEATLLTVGDFTVVVTNVGEWTVDGGWHWINLPSPLVSIGWFVWLPKFYGSPNVTHLGANDFPMTFDAILADCCGANDVTYHWTTSTEGVHIVSPDSSTTEVTVGALPSWGPCRP